jgi:hypothetical protein
LTLGGEKGESVSVVSPSNDDPAYPARKITSYKLKISNKKKYSRSNIPLLASPCTLAMARSSFLFLPLTRDISWRIIKKIEFN